MDPFPNTVTGMPRFLDVDSSFIREQAVNDKLAATAVFDNIAMPGLAAAKIRINPTFS